MVQFKELMTKNRSGKLVMKLPAEANMLPVAACAEMKDHMVVLLTSDHRVGVIPAVEIPAMAKGRGKRLLTLKDERIEDFWIISKKATCVAKLSARKKQVLYAPKERDYVIAVGKRPKKLPVGKSTQKPEIVID